LQNISFLDILKEKGEKYMEKQKKPIYKMVVKE